MECSRIDTILNDHRQGELGAADKAACEAHLLALTVPTQFSVTSCSRPKR
jgi:hypothetical protein